MSDSANILCCCEYYDINNRRNHILSCCCDCVELDEEFENFITGKGFFQHNRNKTAFMATIYDRLRIPWRGGARQVAFDAILPVIILPVMFLLSAVSLWWTVFSFTAVTVILLSIFKFFIYTIPRTKFFFIWTITSVVILYVIFEFIVIPFLQILIEENVTLSILIAAFFLCLYCMKVRNSQMPRHDRFEAETGVREMSFNVCRICQKSIPGRDHHCVWFDCCIGQHNQFLFILTLLFAMTALIYGSNLTLTSVCHPFVFYKTILLPDDCSDVYQQFELGLSFVAALYSLSLAALLLLQLAQQFLLVSIGLSSREWKKLPFFAKCCLGMLSERPNHLGFFKNWSRIMFRNKPYYGNISSA